MDGDLPLADDFKPVPGDDDGGAFGKTEADQGGKLFDDGDEVIPAVAGIDVLINGGAAEESEAVLMLGLRGHHNARSGHCSAHEVVALNRRSGRRAADHATPRQHGVKFPGGERVRIGIHEVPLSAAVKPHAAGLAQWLGEVRGVGDLGIVGMQQGDTGEAILPSPRREHGVVRVGDELPIAAPITTGGRYDDDFGVGSAGASDETFYDAGVAQIASAGDHERPAGRSVVRSALGWTEHSGGWRDGRAARRQCEDEHRRDTDGAVGGRISVGEVEN